MNKVQEVRLVCKDAKAFVFEFDLNDLMKCLLKFLLKSFYKIGFPGPQGLTGAVGMLFKLISL